MQKYDPKSIEPKWQKFWEENKTFSAQGGPAYGEEDPKKEKFYGLIEFPYPSGAGLHVGHPRPFTAMDVISRKKRMEGFNVLYPIGFDAFGLPTENYAIKTGRPPAEVTAENIATFTRQLKSLGYSFDWSRAVDTTDPEYYKWTQWIFLQLYKHGLAYKKKQPINWCPKDKIGLANEEVVDGCCERCGGSVEKRDKEQWMLAITKYADSLLDGLKEVDYIERAKVQQENWIGRSEGINISYDVEGLDKKVTIFTTRPDTNFGATFIALAPDGQFVKENIDSFPKKEEVMNYIEQTKKKNDIERSAEGKEKTGVFTGLYAINNLNGFRMPLYVSDFVLGAVGTGALVGVPGHDMRDFEFAQKMGLEIIRVVVGPDGDMSPITVKEQVQEESGTMMNSEFLNGLDIHVATKKIMEYIEEKGWGKRVVNYKLRDWVFSRQRYWGEPIPLVFCEACKERKYNYIIVHGFTSSSQRGFKPWLKTELEKSGHKVWNPDLPNTNEPNIEEQADFILNNTPFPIDDNTVLVGHSLGGPVVYKILEKIKGKIAKTIFVDPVVKPEFNDQSRPVVEKSTDWKFDWKKIEANAGESIILGDKNFPIIKENHLRELSSALNCGLRMVEPTVGHFSSPEKKDGSLTMEPTILEACQNSGFVTLPEDQLPLKLPKVEKYQPTDTGESPLSAMTDWVNTTCPKCGGSARRETDTMPNWAGSSWYFLRYLDSKNTKALASPEALKYWMNIDWYNGGMEHTVLHLLYSRFWNQFLFDIGVVPTREPYQKRTSHGMILASDGQKMSKSLGNVVNPDEMVAQYGADALRTYIMFMGPFDQAVAWDTNGLVGVRRFLDRVWNLQEKVFEGKHKNSRVDGLCIKIISEVTQDIEQMKFNTAVAKLMQLTNELTKEIYVSTLTYSWLLRLLSPFAPHVCDELWDIIIRSKSKVFSEYKCISKAPWPQFGKDLLNDLGEEEANKAIANAKKEEKFVLAIQVNGKLRDTIEVDTNISEDEAKKLALQLEKVQKYLEGKEPKKVIYVKGKLVSVVV